MSINAHLFGTLVSAGILSLLGTWLLIRLAPSLSLVDVPNERSSHAQPTPRGGGLAFVVGFILFVALARPWLSAELWWLSLISLGVAGLGLVDDIRNVSAAVRFLGQLVAAAALAWVITAVGFEEDQLMRALVVAGVAFCLIAATNFFNFMDGIDGIAATEGVFFSAVAGWLLFDAGLDGHAYLMALLAASLIGFLVFNWSPARIFMGDVGSGFLGFVLAAIALSASLKGAIPLAVWPVLGGTFLADALTTLLRRLATGQRWWAAHRSHAYQGLALRMDSHRRVTTLYLLVNLFWCLPLVLLIMMFPAFQWWLLVIALTPLCAASFLLYNDHTRSGIEHSTTKGD